MSILFKKLFWNSFTLWHARHEAALPFWSREKLERLQNRRVRSIVDYAYATVPFYREEMDKAGLHPLDFRNADDLSMLPLISGDNLADAPDRFLSHPGTDGRSLMLDTSGTSGRSKFIRHDHAELFLMMAYGHRYREVLAHFLGARIGYRELIVCPRWSASIILRDFYEAHSWIPTGMDFKRALIRPEGRVEDNLETINSFRPDLIRGYGSYIGFLFKEAHSRGIPLHRPKAVFYGADRMADHDRNLIENHYGIPVLSSYQSSEFLRIAYQCEKRQGFHINVDHVAVRVVDGKGCAAGPGQRGEIVVSNLVNRATVLLNYKLGDIVTLETGVCPCGRTLPLLGQIDGRARELILLPGGNVVHALVLLDEILPVPGVVQAQIRQHDVGRFSILVVCASGKEWPELKETLEGVIDSFFEIPVEKQIEKVDCIPLDAGGKTRSFISECAP